MKEPQPDTIRSLIETLDRTIDRRNPARTAHAVKRALLDCGPRLAGALPAEFGRAAEDGYARRLLHHGGNYTMVVMTWGPRQGTELHDHAGIWCVECVVQGELEVTQYDLLEQREARCRFEPRSRVHAGVGDAGCLIPPFEYHVLSNALPDETSITLHVYGGDMQQCNCYQPDPQRSGWWHKRRRRLAYTA